MKIRKNFDDHTEPYWLISCDLYKQTKCYSFLEINTDTQYKHYLRLENSYIAALEEIMEFQDITYLTVDDAQIWIPFFRHKKFLCDDIDVSAIGRIKKGTRCSQNILKACIQLGLRCLGGFGLYNDSKHMYVSFRHEMEVVLFSNIKEDELLRIIDKHGLFCESETFVSYCRKHNINETFWVHLTREYIPLKEWAKRNGVAERTARYYCAKGMLKDADVRGNSWIIPADEKKPIRKGDYVISED